MRPCDLFLALALVGCGSSAPPQCVRSAPALPAVASDVWTCRLPGGDVVELVQGPAPSGVVLVAGTTAPLDCWLVPMGRR